MPIPFNDPDDVDELGTAGFLKVLAEDDLSSFQAALFLINGRGEPVEFTYNQVEVPHTFLWRQEDIHRNALGQLARSLLTTCPKVPRLMLCLADEVGSDLFTRDIQLSIPVCRVASAARMTSYAGQETQQEIQDLHLFWFPGQPSLDSDESRLLSALASRSWIL